MMFSLPLRSGVSRKLELARSWPVACAGTSLSSAGYFFDSSSTSSGMTLRASIQPSVVSVVASLDAQPSFFSRVVTGIRNVGGLEYVDNVAAINLQQVGRDDRGRTANLRTARNDNSRAVLYASV